MRYLAAGLALLLLGSCGAPRSQPIDSDVEALPASGGTLVVGASTDIAGVNELLSSTSTFTQSILDQMFLRLFEELPDFDTGPPSFAPALASSWEWSDDRKTLTLWLRSDVVWSNGDPVTAADVEWTWRAQTHPQVAWELADFKENIASVRALDSHTVEAVYHHANSTQLADLNEGLILPSATWSQLPFADWRHNADWFLDHLVTNGPFTLSDWERQQQIVLTRNPRFYLPDRPYLDRVVFRIVPQKVNQVGQLLSGELDFVDHVPAAEAVRLRESQRLQLLQYWTRQYDFICWNVERPLFASAAVRRALTLAIDRQALVDALWFGHAKVAVSPILSSIWAHDDRLEPWPYAPQRTSAILAEAGWHDSDGDGVLDREGRPFVFELITNSNSAVRVDAAVMIQEQLRRVGVRMKIHRLEFNTVVDKALAHDFDAMLGGWTIDTSLDLDYAFHSDSIDGGYNFGGFSDERIDQLLDRLRDQAQIDSMQQILVQVQQRLHHQQPYTFLWEPKRLTAAVVTLKDAQPNALDPFYRLQDWWLLPAR